LIADVDLGVKNVGLVSATLDMLSNNTCPGNKGEREGGGEGGRKERERRGGGEGEKVGRKKERAVREEREESTQMIMGDRR
jgi:hypothetical protein